VEEEESQSRGESKDLLERTGDNLKRRNEDTRIQNVSYNEESLNLQ